MNPTSDATGENGLSPSAEEAAPPASWRQIAAVLAPVLALVALYTPSFAELAAGLWRNSTHSHGPIVLAVAVGLFVVRFKRWAQDSGDAVCPAPVFGVPLLALGFALYVVGRSQAVSVIEVFSLVPMTMGLTLVLFGPSLLRRLWFACFFLLFLVPLPGSVIDSVTQPMKLAVSYATEQLLYAAGYPIARSGVMLGIGPYQLLVADACAGLNSLFMLEAFGLLYLNVVRHPSFMRNVALAVLVVPISFASNVVRVAVLALVTYHFGDAAGQGFIHGFSGMVLFVSALTLTVGVDHVLRRISDWRAHPRGGQP